MRLKLLFCLVISVALSAQAAPQKTTPVKVAEVSYVSFVDEIEALGTLRANESVELTSTVTENITAIHFYDNQRVQKDMLLVEMNADEELAELAEQTSLVAEAERQVQRLEPLADKGAASQAELDQRRREANTARARALATKARLSLREIRAPFDGVVGLRNISVGALAQPGTILTTIDDDHVMKLDFSVPSVFLPALKPGLEIKAKSRAFPERMFKGKISSVDSRVDPSTRSILVRALIENEARHLKPGLLMRVVLQKNPRQALVVPEAALIPNGEQFFVFLLDKRDEMVTVKRQEVQIGTRRKGEVEIISGLEAGQEVVIHGIQRVRPGQPVEVTISEEGI